MGFFSRLKFLKLFVIVTLSSLLMLSVLSISFNHNIRTTVINPQFIEDTLDELEVYPLASEELAKVMKEAADDRGGAKEEERFTEIVGDTITEEWMKEQVHVMLHEFLPYMKSESDTLNLSISFVEIKNNIGTELWESLNNDPPEGTEQLSTELRQVFLQSYFDSSMNELDDNIPDEVDFTPTEIDDLAPFRSGITSFNNAFLPLILLALLIVATIILVIRQVKKSLRVIGAAILISGLICIIVGIVISCTMPGAIMKTELPDMVTEDMVSDILGNFIAPTLTFGIVIAVIGLGMIVSSFTIGRSLKIPRFPERNKGNNDIKGADALELTDPINEPTTSDDIGDLEVLEVTETSDLTKVFESDEDSGSTEVAEDTNVIDITTQEPPQNQSGSQIPYDRRDFTIN